LGTYYLAQHAELTGKTKKARKLYESAALLNEVAHIDRDFILSKIEELSVTDLDEDLDEDNEDN
jgi:hypothetical protein